MRRTVQRIAVALAALLYASPSLAEWVVSKDPMGPKTRPIEKR